MVLEHIFTEKDLEHKLDVSFVLGGLYAILSIIIAHGLFNHSEWLFSIMLTTILSFPTMIGIIGKELKTELKEKKLTIEKLWQDNKDAVKVYTAFFFAIFIVYTAAGVIMGDSINVNSELIIAEMDVPQLYQVGHAFEMGTFEHLLVSGWWLIFTCFALGIITGHGGVFILIYSAAVWGLLTGVRVVLGAPGELWQSTLTVLVLTLPFIIIKAVAYIMATLAGGVISAEVTAHSKDMKRMIEYIILYLILFMAVRLVLHNFLGTNSILGVVVQAAVIIAFIVSLGNSFKDKKHKIVFRYNLHLFLFALMLLIIGVWVETLILSNSRLLAEIFLQAANPIIT